MESRWMCLIPGTVLTEGNPVRTQSSQSKSSIQSYEDDSYLDYASSVSMGSRHLGQSFPCRVSLSSFFRLTNWRSVQANLTRCVETLEFVIGLHHYKRVCKTRSYCLRGATALVVCSSDTWRKTLSQFFPPKVSDMLSGNFFSSNQSTYSLTCILAVVDFCTKQAAASMAKRVCLFVHLLNTYTWIKIHKMCIGITLEVIS